MYFAKAKYGKEKRPPGVATIMAVRGAGAPKISGSWSFCKFTLAGRMAFTDPLCTINMLYNIEIVYIFVKKIYEIMTFERIVDDGRLWAVRYDGKEINCFEELFGHWYDMQWLRDFFQNNISDLESFFSYFKCL